MTQPPPLPGSGRKNSPIIIIAIVVGLLFAVFAGVGVLAAILIPTVGKVRETARRTVDNSNARMILQSAMVWAIDHDGQLPPVKLSPEGNAEGTEDATIQSLAAALARGGGLVEASVWFPATGPDTPGANDIAAVAVLDDGGNRIHPAFASQQAFAWDFATGLSFTDHPNTPVLWTRGLKTDGTWDSVSGVYGTDGGFVAFLDGSVIFFADLQTTQLVRPNGTTTSNILETLPTSARVVGAGSGTLHGRQGLASRSR